MILQRPQIFNYLREGWEEKNTLVSFTVPWRVFKLTLAWRSKDNLNSPAHSVEYNCSSPFPFLAELGLSAFL